MVLKRNENCRHRFPCDPYSHDTLHVLDKFQSSSDSAVIKGSEGVNRRIPNQPSRILDAPDLVDDYYLNLISWSKDNILAVALAHCVYLWNASTGDIHHLTTIEGDDDCVSSVQWCNQFQPPAAKPVQFVAAGPNFNQSNNYPSVDISTASPHRTVAIFKASQTPEGKQSQQKVDEVEASERNLCLQHSHNVDTKMDDVFEARAQSIRDEKATLERI